MSDIALYDEVADQVNHDALIAQHADLVKKIAFHLLNRLPQSIQLQDLVQSGMVGLMEAARNYRTDKGCSFETFAGFRIRGAMLDDIRKGDWVPRSVYQNSRQISNAIHEVEQRTGREAKPEEIAKVLDVDLNKYYQMLGDTGGCDLFSLDDINIENAESINERDNPASKIQRSEMKNLVKNLIKELPEKEQLVLSLYHNEELNLKDIGSILDVSESRVSQIHSQAIKRLRARIKSVIK